MTALEAATAPVSVAARRQAARLTALDFGGFHAARVVTAADWAAVAAMRAAGFGRTLRPRMAAPSAWLDGWDHAGNAHVAVVRETPHGPILASMRLLDSRAGELELATHVDLQALLPAACWPLRQAARMCAISHVRRVEALFALQKAIWARALRDGVQTLILATPYWSRWMYEALQFTDLGDAAMFSHPLTGALHRVMIFHVPSAQSRLEAAGNPLSRQLFRTSHPTLDY